MCRPSYHLGEDLGCFRAIFDSFNILSVSDAGSDADGGAGTGIIVGKPTRNAAWLVALRSCGVFGDVSLMRRVRLVLLRRIAPLDRVGRCISEPLAARRMIVARCEDTLWVGTVGRCNKCSASRDVGPEIAPFDVLWSVCRNPAPLVV